ncbi:MAG: MG2 domain-containing protein [Anaerolineae bacterium]|nr:MG2 domain-containing protein [Anaerolineae bacterium]
MTAQSPHPASRWLATALQLLIIFSVVAGLVAAWWVNTLPQRADEQQTLLLGPTRFAPDSEGAVRVIVQDFGRGRPIANAVVKVSLKPADGRAIPLFEGRTDESGSLPVRFHIPADAPQEAMLVVETRSRAGRDKLEQAVTIRRDYRLLLTTDKPLYQPGQTIHMRALALSAFDLTPARGATVNFLVEDAKGNKVFRQSVPASEFGVAAADFTLADLVNQGHYKIAVAIGETVSEKTVEVRPYVLPKFAVNVATDRSFYLPGQRVQGSVQADYFFGKPVAQGQVRIVGSVWEIERVVVVDLQGQTDENGRYEFSFDLPEYFAGSGLESGQSQFALEVTVIDQTDHAEQTSTILPIAAQPLVIEAVAESGMLKPGVENIVYILTSYPDGRPAPTKLQIRVDNGPVTELVTGEYGLAEFTFTPHAGHLLSITARDETGAQASRAIGLDAESGADSVLLRADRAAYVVGETMHLVALTPVRSGSIYLDIVKSGQTLSTRSAPVENGKAEFTVDVSPDLYGTLELHAYKALLDGTIVRDTRLVVVDAPNAVAIAVASDKDTYLPGDTATIGFQTSDASGAGVQTALGVAIVDESVFALQRQDPGFAKLYFLLEQELLEPFYQIKGFELPAAIPPEEQEIRAAQDMAARATAAQVTGAARLAAPAPINSRPLKMAAVYATQEKSFARIGQASAVGLLLIPLLAWGVAIAALWRSGVVKRALKRWAAALFAIGVFGCCASGWLTMLTGMFYSLNPAEVFAPPAFLFGLITLCFAGYAWVENDQAGQLLSTLALAWGAWLGLLIWSGPRGVFPSEGLLLAGLLAFALLPGAYLLFGQLRWVQAKRLGAWLATGLGMLSALPAAILISAVSLSVLTYGGVTAGMRPIPTEVVLQVVEATREVEKAVEVGAEDARRDQQTAAEGPRLRQWFPETLFWDPEVLTDESGRASLKVPIADSITTWRLTALASTQDGRLGFTTRGVRVFQDFFVDIDLPLALTQDDEISVPVGVFNYLPEAQQVRLEVKPEPWFELLGAGEQTLTIASNDIEVVYFPIRVLKFGRHGFQVTAWGEKMSDAIRREVNVLPNGKEFWLSESDWLRESKEIEITLPPDTVPETPYVEVKIYPGVLAQVVEGLEKILRLPHG